MLKNSLAMTALTISLQGSAVVAQEDFGQAWVDSMNACELLISEQTFAGFQGYSDAPSTLNVLPQSERGFQHPELPLNATAANNSFEWYLCVVTGETGESQDSVIATVTETIRAQIRDQGNHAVVLNDDKIIGPIRVICRGDEQLTSIIAYYGDEGDFRIAATYRLPNSVENPCQMEADRLS